MARPVADRTGTGTSPRLACRPTRVQEPSAERCLTCFRPVMTAIQPSPGYRSRPWGTHRSMRPPPRSARRRRRYPAQAPRDPFTALAFEELQRPPPHPAKDFLGAAATIAIVAAILLMVSNSLARPCRVQLNPRTGPSTCGGISAIANHAHGVVTWGAAACAALAAATFVWYMFWGYKANRHIGGNRETGGSQG